MKKVKKILMALLPSFFIVGMCIPAFLNSGDSKDVAGEDTAIYNKAAPYALLDHPDITHLLGAGDEDEEEEEVIEVDKVILHYYNEAGGCKGRAFYLWVTGEDGVEYSLDNADDIISVNDDETMMTINIDFTDPRFTAFANKGSMYFIIKFKKISDTNLNWGGQSDDVQLRYTDFPPSKEKVCEVWTMPAAGGGIAILDSEAKTKVHGVKLAKFEDWKTIKCELTDNTTSVDWKLYAFDETYYKIKPKKRADAQKWYLVKQGTNSGDFSINLPNDAHINLVYSLVSHDPSSDSDPDMKDLDKTVTVGFENLYNSAKFNKYYDSYAGTDLGVTYSKEETTFKVWSPVSANMTVLLYDSDTPKEFGGEDAYSGYHMQYTSGGIWSLTIKGDLKGKYYNYQVDNTLGTNVVMDPYATSAGCNGIRGYVYDKAETNPEGWDALPLKWDGVDGYDLETPQDLTIYEVHVQDFTGDESWISTGSTKRGTYNAFVEKGTKVKGTDIPTGYDHLDKLGVGAVQLVPVFDHDNDESGEELKYNWGYNPLNYNVVEGGYSSNPHDGFARVKEFKNLILQMSKTEAHTRVIMDVVYNHVSSATGSNFHKLMPRYYFRYTPEGELYDGSGCHNEVATERPMMRKFIVDSLSMWAKEYKIKGFRFDLMGLIDFKTMHAVQKALYAIDPDIYIYGEGWSLGYNGEGSQNWWNAHQGAEDPHNFGTETWQVYNECNRFIVGDDSVYLGGFNDRFRNAVRGENGSQWDGKTYPGGGLIQNGNFPGGRTTPDTGVLDTVSDGLWGVNSGVYAGDKKTGIYPEQTVNYVSCHDNWTVRDQLYNTLTNSDGSHPAKIESMLRASLEAHALVMASNSAAFFLGGEELLRTKEYTIDPSTVTGVTADSWTDMWGHKISHNSYNAPLSVNSFKWGNKVKVECDGTTITNDVYHYNEAFQTLIKSHKGLLKKRGENTDYYSFVNKTSANKDSTNRYWSQEGNFSNCVGFQANEAFVYASFGNTNAGDYIQCDQNAMNAWSKLFEYGSTNIADNKIYFSGEDWNAVLFYDRHGKQEGMV